MENNSFTPENSVLDINRALDRMYSLEAVVFDDRWPDMDLVQQFRSERTGVAAPILEEVDKHIFVKTLEELSRHRNSDLMNRRFLNGGVAPELNLSYKDFYEFFKRLVKGYHKYADLVLRWEILAKSSILASEYPSLARILAGKKPLPEDQEVGEEKFDKRIHFELLRLFLTDLSETGEQISYGRAVFFGEYLHDLVQLKQDKRYTFIQKMISREYPFTDENQGDWRGYLMTE